jgi:tetratricopeptide (TPR) repeat protein
MDHAARARALFDRDNFGPAIDHALLAMRDADAATQRDLRALVGACLQHRRASVQALYQLDQVLAEQPDHARALTHRGAARQQLSQQKLAQPDLRRATELDPDYPFAWQWLAYASFDLGDNDTLDEAMANLERLGKPQGYLYQLRGKRRLDNGDRAGAEADLRRGCVEGDAMAACHLEDAGFPSSRARSFAPTASTARRVG